MSGYVPTLTTMRFALSAHQHSYAALYRLAGFRVELSRSYLFCSSLHQRNLLLC